MFVFHFFPTQVLYHGSTGDLSGRRPLPSHGGDGSMRSHGGGDDKSILSMKKSAEIAAVFSGARISQITNIVNENEETAEEEDDDVSVSSTDMAYDTKRGGCQCGSGSGSGSGSGKEAGNVRRRNFSKANMQSTLGYFP